MLVYQLHLVLFFICIFNLMFIQANRTAINHHPMIYSNMTLDGNLTTSVTSKQLLFTQGQEFLHRRINGTTLLWSTIALVTISALISMYIAIKMFM